MAQNGQPKPEPQAEPEQKALQKVPKLAIPVATSGGLMPRDYGELIEFAKMVAYSGMVPKSYEGNTGAVLVAVQMGAELGLTPMSSVRSICVINGMPSVWGDGMLALVVSHRDCEDVIESIEGVPGERVAVCTVKRRGRAPVTRKFSWADAERANLDSKKGPWQQYPQRMLQMRARSWALRDAFPDVLQGIRATEEAQDSIDMGQADYLDPAPGPDHNPMTDIPPAGTSNFGRRASSGAPRETPPQEATESTGSPPADQESAQSDSRPEAPPPSESSDASERTELGWPKQAAEGQPQDEEEPPPPEPSQAELESEGQGTLGGAGF